MVWGNLRLASGQRITHTHEVYLVQVACCFVHRGGVEQRVYFAARQRELDFRYEFEDFGLVVRYTTSSSDAMLTWNISVLTFLLLVIQRNHWDYSCVLEACKVRQMLYAGR